MRSIFYILAFIVCLFAWDIQSRVLYLFQRRKFADYWNNLFKKMSRFVFILARVFVGMDLKTSTALPLDQLPQRFIVVSNHQSLADIPAIVLALPCHDLKYTAKNELKYGIPTVSVSLRLGNHAFIDRHGSFHSTRRQLQKLLELPGEHICPVVFPEGTRSRTGEIGKFHEAGVRFLLENSDLPVVSVAVEGGYLISKFTDILFRLKNLKYKVKVLKAYPNVKGKHGIQTLLSEIRIDIEQQLKIWRE